MSATPTERFVVLAAMDDDDYANVVTVAARFASGIQGGELHLAHAISLPPGREAIVARALLDEARGRLVAAGDIVANAYPRTAIGHLLIGAPTHEILQLAASLKADLLIVGTHGRTGIERFVIGSVAEHVVRRASCPVLVVREKNYQTDLEPEIEPPCVDCVALQTQTRSEKMWCARHSERHPRAHTIYETPESFALGSSIIRPD